jgi:hypothetical protein
MKPAHGSQSRKTVAPGRPEIALVFCRHSDRLGQTFRHLALSVLSAREAAGPVPDFTTVTNIREYLFVFVRIHHDAF